MRILLTLLFVFLSFSSNCFAQSELQHLYGTTQADWCTDAHATSDGGYIMAGMTYDTNQGWDVGATLIKTDAGGNIVWEFCADSMNTTRYVTVVEDPSDQGFIAVTSSAKNWKSSTGSDANAWMFKVDNTGTLVWSKYLSGDLNVTTKYDYFQSIRATTDGNFIALGYSEATSFSSGHGSLDIVACKFNSAGTLIWTRAVGAGSFDYGFSVEQCSDGDYIFYGYSGGELCLVKVSPDGTTVTWANTYDMGSSGFIPGAFDSGWGSMYVTNSSITETQDGGFVVVGYDGSGPHGSDDIYVMKVNSAGALVWAKEYGEGGNDRAAGVVTLDNGDLMVAGHTYSTALRVQSADMFLMRLDNTNGNVKWFYTYNSTGAAGSEKETVLSIDLKGTTGLVIGGAYDNNLGCGAMDNHLLLIDTSGLTSCIDPGILVRSDKTADLLSVAITPVVTAGGTMLTLTPTEWGGGMYGSWTPTCDVELCALILPIDLVEFSGENKGSYNEIEWKTASELNNDYFTIEKSNKAVDWEVLHEVKGAGNSSSLLEYQFIDDRPFSSLTYYRLKQTDLDGRFKYSQTIAVQSKLTEVLFSDLYPNPAAEYVSFDYFKVYSDLNILIYNVQGSLIKEITYDNLALDGNLKLTTSDFENGMYFMFITANDLTETRRLLISSW
ncbi:T9SS type A sorting domain-containing protein [bacterium AH-315-C20]|nr:T9SS type A sorting domain-containing protein [bacterium AH-315-C20]